MRNGRHAQVSCFLLRGAGVGPKHVILKLPN
jgi:hypothetical protein